MTPEDATARRGAKGFAFDDPGFVARYAEGPPKFVPGYRSMQQMATQLLRERAGDEAEILVVGAGGGLELDVFATLNPEWRFTGVDPAPEMVKQAQHVTQAHGAHRFHWVNGLIHDAPPGPFDGASCLLTLHFVPDDGAKLETLRAIHQRLRSGAALVVVDHCLDKAAADYPTKLDRYVRFAIDSGAPEADVAMARQQVNAAVNMVGPEREEQLLGEAGFAGIELFYTGLAWRGWVARAAR